MKKIFLENVTFKKHVRYMYITCDKSDQNSLFHFFIIFLMFVCFFSLISSLQTHNFEIAPNISVECEVDTNFKRLFVTTPPKIVQKNRIFYESKNISGKLDLYDEIKTKKHKYYISKILDYAFYGTNITEVVLTSKIYSIGVSAFANCPNLVKADFSKTSLHKIPNGLFNNSNNLREFIPTMTYVTIGEYAFAHTQIANITLTKMLKHISSSALANCSKLEKIDIDPKNTIYVLKGKCLYSKNLKTILYQFSDVANTNILNETEEIGEYCYAFSQVETAVIPAHIEKISDSAFLGCHQLTKITFERGRLTSIGDYCFLGCGLKYLDLPPTIQSIGMMSLGLPNATDIDLTATNISYVPERLFFGAEKLYEVALPNTISDVHAAAFLDASIHRILYCGEYSFKQYNLPYEIDLLCDKKRDIKQIDVDDDEDDLGDIDPDLLEIEKWIESDSFNDKGLYDPLSNDEL